MRRAIFCVLVLMLMPAGFGFGVTPAKITIRHGTDSGEFSFRTIDAESGTVTAYVNGNLAEYIDLAVEGDTVRGRLIWPNPEPGVHTQYVIVRLIPGSAEGTISGETQLAPQLIVKVPYPEAYLEASWEATTDYGSGDVVFVVTLENLGSLTVLPDSVEILLDGDVVTLNAHAVEAGSYQQIQSTYPGMKGKLPGTHLATLAVDYNGRTLRDTKEFVIGVLRVSLTEVIFSNEQGVIKPLDIAGEVFWNQPIQGIVRVYYDGSTSPVIEQNVTLHRHFSERIYLDTARVGLPSEVIRVAVSVRDSSDEKSIVIPPLSADLRVNWWPVALGALVLSLVVLLWFRFYHRRS